MAKKQKVDANATGFETFDLLSGNTFDPIAQEAKEAAFWEEETNKIKENIREPVWHDILKLICNQKIKNKESLSYDNITNFTKDNAFFMILEGYAHIQPQLANIINHKDISPHHAMDIIYKHMRKKYPKAGWPLMQKFYPIMKKEKKGVDIVSKEGKTINIEITENDIKDYCKEHRISLREFQDSLDLARDTGTDTDKYLAEWIYYKRELENGGSVVKVAKKNKASYDDDTDHIEVPDNVKHPTVLVPEYVASLWDAKLGRKRETSQKVNVEKSEIPQKSQEPVQQVQQNYNPSPQQTVFSQQQQQVIVHQQAPVTEPTSEQFKKPAKATVRKQTKFVAPEEPTDYVTVTNYFNPDGQKEHLIPKNIDGKVVMFVHTDLHILDNIV